MIAAHGKYDNQGCVAGHLMVGVGGGGGGGQGKFSFILILLFEDQTLQEVGFRKKQGKCS